jgi:PHD/YefM family antitoxin component YafN of YafNO toxin-antitoxin module
MVTYAQNELASSTEISKQFGHYLSNVSNGIVEKIAILKNNKVEAVMIPTAIYESLISLLNEKEDMEILKTVEKRMETPREEYLDGRDVLEELGLSVEG